MNRRVLLLRSAREDDPYERALEAAGYEVTSMPVLSFRQVNLDDLREALQRPNSYRGLIFTSPRAVDAFGDAMAWLPSENVRWHGRPLFVVGPRSAQALRQLGFEPTGEDTGSAAALASRILKDGPGRRPYLFLCGNRRRDALPNALTSAGIAFDEICVYRTLAQEELPWPDGQIDWIVAFSPSGVEAMEDDGPVAEDGPRFAAIGPTTAAALQSHGFLVDAVADAPAPRALRAAIRSADDRRDAG